MPVRRGGLTTIAVHAGERYDPSTGAVGTPIFQNSTFYYPRKPDANGKWVESDFVYTRFGNPTTRAAEEKIAALEDAEDAVCFSSGMAAIAASLLSLLKPGDSIVSQASVYGGSTTLFNNQFRRLGITTNYSFEGSAEDLLARVDESTRVVFVEAPSNPFNYIVDLPKLAAGLRKAWGRDRPKIVIDATTASPANFRPLENGADLVVHSATKYLNGHSDIIAGVVAGPQGLVEAIRPWLRGLGGSMDPHAAFLLRRGLATLALRMERHNLNGRLVSEFLESQRKVEAVWHPSLRSHPHYQLGKRLMKGYGSLIAFQPRTRNRLRARRFLEALDVFHVAASLGGVESLAGFPVETQHRFTTTSMRKKLGITPTLVRLAVGIEDADDLIGDLRQAIRRL
jgi:cystathionine beta-lyase/cystathionine gamma-synthase